MARMVRMIVSIPAEDKKWLEAESRRRKISVSELIRLAIREFQKRVDGEERRAALARVAEKRAEYKDPEQPAENGSGIESIIDMKELRRRAAAAVGRFASGVPDLSIEHDRYAWGEPGDAGDASNKTYEESRTKSGSGTGHGARSGKERAR